ncbi:MAG TPA: hypothetical protein VGN64_20165 [Dyadobacter sp.]|nr:hypothetical protein [Dyadobacter sp.]
MRSKTLPCYLLLIVLSAWSCTGMKNMSSTLNKSDGSAPVAAADTRHGNYLPQTGTAQETAVKSDPQKADGSYRKDYSTIADAPTAKSSSARVETSDQYDRLTKLYEEMDKLGDVVLYEIDIAERRYNNLLADYKNANAENRQQISRELDKLNADQMTLYKSYASIYKRGKTDWPNVRAEVDATLLKLRGLTNK